MPIALIGVGPGRDQVIWTEAGRNSLAAAAPAVGLVADRPLSTTMSCSARFSSSQSGHR